MKTYEIDGPWPGRLAVIARPRGGEWLTNDLCRLRETFDVLVSLLTANESDQFQLSLEREVSKAYGLEFINFSVEDLGVPQSVSAFRKLLDGLMAALKAGKRVAIHCRQGIGRSGLLAIMLLASADVDPADAIRRVSEARGLPVPETAAQKEWVMKVAEDFVDTLANR
jgi:protein-tyrosine phosphatase